MHKPVDITVITAVYNGSSTITDCLKSVGSQTYPVEHLIVDGKSTDNTVDMVRSINPSCRIISEKDQGIYDAMNKGIRQSTGDVIGILNSDDFYASPNVIKKVVSVFQDPSVGCCYGDLVYITDPGGKESVTLGLEDDHPITRFWKSGTFHPSKFYWGWMPPHPTFFVRRHIYEECGLFNLDLGSAADYELMLRFLLKHRISCRYIPEVLVKMRAGGVSNASIKNRLAANRMDRRAWNVNQLRPFPWTLYLKPVRKLGQWLAKPPKP